VHGSRLGEADQAAELCERNKGTRHSAETWQRWNHCEGVRGRIIWGAPRRKITHGMLHSGGRNGTCSLQVREAADSDEVVNRGRACGAIRLSESRTASKTVRHCAGIYIWTGDTVSGQHEYDGPCGERAVSYKVFLGKKASRQRRGDCKAPRNKGHVRKSTDEASAGSAVCIGEGRFDWVDFTRVVNSSFVC
jgi:hypothetical protein